MHGRLRAKNVCRHHNVLREVLWHAASDHQQTGRRVLNLQLCQFVKVLARVDGAHLFALARVLVRHDAEAEGAIGKGRDEDRHVQLIGGEHDGIRVAVLRRAGILFQVAAHLANELAR